MISEMLVSILSILGSSKINLSLKLSLVLIGRFSISMLLAVMIFVLFLSMSLLIEASSSFFAFVVRLRACFDALFAF